ncbi:MAG: DUF192 domain-containing protein [Nanoarchaeota archaeon]
MKCKIYSNPFSLSLGLRFHRKLKKDDILILKFKKEREIRLSMNFVFFPITALWVNKNNIITHIERLQPFTYSQKKKALYIAEMSLTNKYKRGQKLKIK